ncbi:MULTISPECIES: acyl-CoA dehydrogenase family protein [Bacillus cereus group]|uniref:acyl-CoA dehydrogenase family protein n=1 Tax=Bacillus cereus group TaxID=86661 RepID=UPI0011CCDB32|nr:MULTISPECIES: acyl-CoA dehydrogenase family protein [Bacillus cereus group]QWG81530.1 acyl-CoA dehydrogenase [Bacillus mycoides]TXR81559.1 acyl-CoA dehydrogenase [Bacillus sp. AR13-1]
MEMNWSEKQLEYIENFKNLGTLISEKTEENYWNHQFDLDSWKKVSDAGLWRIPVPVEYGGSGQSWWEFAAALEGLSKTAKDFGFLLSTIAHIGCIRVLLNYGTEEQKKIFLPKLMNHSVGATAITEQTGGSDVARIKTSGEKYDNFYLLNGRKAHITNAPVADIMVIVGRIPKLGEKDITLFIVEREYDGLSFEPAEDMLGNHTSPTGDIILSNVKIEEKNILGNKGDGLNTLYNMISLDRLLYGLISAGYSEHILEQCMNYAKERTAFKSPIIDKQYIQQLLVEIKVNMESSRWTSYGALQKLINDDPEASMMCSLAKLVGSEGLYKNTENAIRLHGHKGYMKGEISRKFCDAFGTVIAGGTSDIQRINIFQQLNRLSKQEELNYELSN